VCAGRRGNGEGREREKTYYIRKYIFPRKSNHLVQSISDKIADRNSRKDLPRIRHGLAGLALLAVAVDAFVPRVALDLSKNGMILR
jgi:hypothetical protein